MGILASNGRVLLALIFISSGWSKFTAFGETGGPALAYAAPKLAEAKALLLAKTGFDVKTLPLEDKHYLAFATSLELMGGFLFLMDSSLGANMLILFLILVSPVMHDFWKLDPKSTVYTHEMVNFFKNMSILGGLLLYKSLKAEVAALRSGKVKRA